MQWRDYYQLRFCFQGERKKYVALSTVREAVEGK